MNGAQPLARRCLSVMLTCSWILGWLGGSTTPTVLHPIHVMMNPTVYIYGVIAFGDVAALASGFRWTGHKIWDNCFAAVAIGPADSYDSASSYSEHIGCLGYVPWYGT